MTFLHRCLFVFNPCLFYTFICLSSGKYFQVFDMSVIITGFRSHVCSQQVLHVLLCHPVCSLQVLDVVTFHPIFACSLHVFHVLAMCSPPHHQREREGEREIVSSYVMYISYNTYSWIVLPNRICSHPHSMSACACFVCFHTQRAEALFDVLYVALFCKLDSWTDLGVYAHAFMLKVCHYTRQCARDSFYVISICHAENTGECFS